MSSIEIARKNWAFLPASYFSRSIGKKVVVAITGFMLLGWITGHMAGNLQIFVGQEALNRYAAFLQGLGELLWLLRGVMALVLILHVWFAVQLKLENWAARPQRYEHNATVQATLSSRTMIWTGLLIFSFATFHLLHFTFQSIHPEWKTLEDSLGRHDVYSMVILGFKDPVMAISYVIMMAALAYHLSHAIRSMFQTVGLNNQSYDGGLRVLSLLIAWVLFLGYISIPIATLIGFLKLPGGVTI
jgi:succinate dehydrogenase / fumarate reductase, cytochrome b subunit